MTQARSEQISLQDTPYYHCISRCVRRAYLCGNDEASGQNFDHRKAWLVVEMKRLASCFAIDICAYAVMSNHYHVVLFVNQSKALEWPDEEVIRRWTELFPRNAALVSTLLANQKSSVARKQLKNTVQLWRERLQDISWFMRCLNEPIARRANKEDECTGRFWEGRFKSQALLDERAVVTCMAYVDLNPIRAGICKSLEEADFTSIQERLVAHARRVRQPTPKQTKLIRRYEKKHLKLLSEKLQKQANTQLKPLLGASNGVADNNSGFFGNSSEISIKRDDYIALLEWTASSVGAKKSSSRHFTTTPASKLQKINHTSTSWLQWSNHFEKRFAQAAGSNSSLKLFHLHRHKNNTTLKHPDKWIRGLET